MSGAPFWHLLISLRAISLPHCIPLGPAIRRTMKSPEHLQRRRRRVQRIALWSVLLLLLLGVINFWAGVGFQRGEARIALITVDGVILGSRSFVEQIERYREDKNIAGMVVRVDSPGGGVAPSQEIHQALRRFREAGKVLVTSMGSVAASGGLYVSLASTKIFANPGTITGSIGVIMEVGQRRGSIEGRWGFAWRW